MVRKNIQSWLSETHGSQFELFRHFLSEQLVNDLISSDQVRRFVITVLAVLACVGPLIVRLYMPKYKYLEGLDTGDLYLAAVRADRLFFISLSMIVAGLVTVVQWQGLFPSLRDYLALKPLPLRLYQIFVARFLSSFVILVVVIADLILATSILFPLLTSGRWQSPSFGIRYVLAHAAATLCAGLFAFFAISALQGALMNLLPPRAFDRLSVLFQAVFATAFVAATPYVFDIPNWYEMIAARPSWMLLFPPAWFLGLYETLLGARDGYFLRLRDMAILGIETALFLALATYFLSYRRHASRVLEQALPKPSGRSPIGEPAAALLGMLMRNSLGWAAFVFALQTLRRSRPHKLVIGFCVAIALLLALQTAGPSMVAHLRSGESWSIWQLESILAVPLVISAVLISALCYVFQLPSQVEASWVFRMAETLGPRELLASVEYLLVFFGLMPVLLVTLPFEALGLGWVLAFAHIALVAVLMLWLIEVRLREWHKIPFTCSYVPGRRNLWQTMGAYLLLFGVLVPAITYFEVHLLRPFVLLGVAGMISFFYFSMRSAREAQWRIVPLLFDESDEPLIRTLRLNRE
jgi:hypothetical protein